MMKKMFAVSMLLMLVFAFAGCSDNKDSAQIARQNQAQASSPTVKMSELNNVSPDAAIDIALKDADVPREEAVFFGTPSLDEEKDGAHYDIKFEYNGFEYDYEIAVNDGAVLKAEKDKEETPVVSSSSPKETVSASKNNGYISIEDAKQKALENAGAAAQDAVFKKAYYDADDLVAHYDIKFVSGGYEYEYEIKASDGSILEKEVDREKGIEKSTAENAAYISEDEAKSIAFSHASVDASNVKFSKVELDRDDMIVHYDVEFVEGKYEYEYEINAETGKVIAFDKDFND